MLPEHGDQSPLEISVKVKILFQKIISENFTYRLIFLSLKRDNGSKQQTFECLIILFKFKTS